MILGHHKELLINIMDEKKFFNTKLQIILTEEQNLNSNFDLLQVE